MELLTPKYITEETSKQAMDFALEMVLGNSSSIRPLLSRHHCHIVILVPAMEDARAENFPKWPVYPVQPKVFHERSVGKTSEWEYPFKEIAQCKALQLWTGRNDDRTSSIPHLLFPGDTPFWGGVKRRGLVVTCSGFQPYFDKLVSGVVADNLVALAHYMYENDAEVQDKVSFLS